MNTEHHMGRMDAENDTPLVTSWHCAECGHCHTPAGCIGDHTPSDRWAGVTPASCDCDETYVIPPGSAALS